MLTPVHYRRKIARPVSCYALFKWWLLLSQHPGCLSNLTSLVTEHRFGTLTVVWVVSLSTAQLIPRGLTAGVVITVFGVWFGEVPREGPPSNSVSLPP